MAVLGFQMCFTLIMASFLQKLAPIYSFGRWLLCNGSLTYYKQPTNSELQKLSGKHFEKLKGKRKAKSPVERELQTFKIPKNLEIELDSGKVGFIDTLQLRNYSEYEWLVNYTLFVVFVYIATEIYYEVWTPSNDFNISVIWIALSVSFAIKNMITILRLYLKSAGGEIYLSITWAVFSLILALGVLMVNDDYLDFGLNTLTVGDEAAKFDVSGLKLVLVFVSGLHGLIFAFPAFRMAQMYSDALRYSGDNRLLNFFLHFNFCAPALVAALWVKPIVNDFLLRPGLGNGTRVQEPLLSVGRFEVFRVAFCVFVCVLRVTLIRHHLQAYLNIAYDKMLKLRKEAGKISNIELKSMVARIYYYLGVVTIQYLSPVIVHLALTFYLKTLGNYSWRILIDSSASEFLPVKQAINSTSTPLSYESSFADMVSAYDSNIKGYTAAASAVVSPVVFRALFSYLVFFASANWFLATCLGLLNHSYLSK